MYIGYKGNIWLLKYFVKSDGKKKFGIKYKDEGKIY